ncbi:MAG: hypothetical protein ACFHXK_08055 [bacterium]
MSNAIIAAAAEPEGFHCPNCRNELPARTDYWNKAALEQGYNGADWCKPCKLARGMNVKCSTTSPSIRRMSLIELLELRDHLTETSQPIPLTLFQRMAKEANKMARNAAYAEARLLGDDLTGPTPDDE